MLVDSAPTQSVCEVSQPLHQLTKAKCLQEPGGEVNISILHINGCSVSRVFPVFLITKCRASAHLVIYVKDSPYISLPSHNYYTISRTAPAPRTITATFIQSNVSGMPEGVVNGATERAVVRVEGGKMDVLETRSFSGYPRDAQVSVSFKDTQILTVKQGAFDLPPTAQLKVEGGKMVRVETYSYSGGAKLFLSGVVVGNLLPSAVNIYGLMKLSVVNCTMAVVYANAFTHRAPTYVRTITGGQEVLEGSEAIFSGNRLTSGNGEAFASLCSVDKLSWQNNYVRGFSDMPLRFQNARCTTKRDWAQVFSLNGLSCINCTDFANPDKQSCGLYESGHCNGCEKEMDGCNKPILPYLTDKCRASHPDIARDLKNTCNINAYRRTAKALPVQDKEEVTGASASFMPLSSIVTLAVAMLVVAPE
ncbi:uncharacterized protein LOC123512179 isoform X2 [Portunus trituberculatus]|uniref:uncharacterized protein LOC123512179 isoform X2 n=1 Tax=Portunus trituberculatus TaxID=210409 RepID=UPI001E1CBA14|nr:uncharacterized protein LOC123512179 isoform X2 [Portunus trituberculatus]